MNGITNHNSYRVNWLTPPAQFTSRPRRDAPVPPIERKQSWAFYVVLLAIATGAVYLVRRV